MWNQVARWTGWLVLLLLVSTGGVRANQLDPLSLQNRDRALKEYAAARTDNADLLVAISRCYQDFDDPLKWSAAVQAILADERSTHLAPLGEWVLRGAAPGLKPYHAAAIAFSDKLSRERLKFAQELDAKQRAGHLYQWAIVILGALATITVSFRSMLGTDASKRCSLIAGLVAMVLSAASTAVSTMNTYDGDQALVLRDERAVAQLEQLHWRVVSDVVNKVDLCVHPESDMQRVEAWKVRWEKIMDEAVESIARPGDLSTASVPETAPRPLLPPEPGATLAEFGQHRG
jgi:hypothetical protein